MNKQYWMRTKYEDGVERWELSEGKFKNADTANKAYAPRAKALGFKIVEVKPHEQFEFRYKEQAPEGCDYGIGG
jgi:hypothetical protein